MPDPSGFDRGAMLASFEKSSGMGGIVVSSNYKGFSVEIRPSKWKKKIWIGKLETFPLAQYVADAVRHYVGLSPIHFNEGDITLPAITCIGTVIGTPVVLSTRDACAIYVSKIAKGDDFERQREDFIMQVKKVVKHRDFPYMALPRTDDEPDDEPDDDFEEDEQAANAVRMSSHPGSSGVSEAVVQTHGAGPVSVGGSEGVPAFVPTFDVDPNVSENNLRSAEQCFDAIVFSMDDCPSEDDEFWTEAIDKLTAPGACTPSVLSNDFEVCPDGCDTSPILDIPPIVRSYAQPFSKPLGAPVECAGLRRDVPGSSSDCPSSQFAKRQKIVD